MSKELETIMQLVAVTFSGINLLALITVVFKAGGLLKTFDSVVEKVKKLEERTDAHSELIFRTAEKLDGMDVRLRLVEQKP